MENSFRMTMCLTLASCIVLATPSCVSSTHTQTEDMFPSLDLPVVEGICHNPLGHRQFVIELGFNGTCLVRGEQMTSLGVERRLAKFRKAFGGDAPVLLAADARLSSGRVGEVIDIVHRSGLYRLGLIAAKSENQEWVGSIPCILPVPSADDESRYTLQLSSRASSLNGKKLSDRDLEKWLSSEPKISDSPMRVNISPKLTYGRIVHVVHLLTRYGVIPVLSSKPGNPTINE